MIYGVFWCFVALGTRECHPVQIAVLGSGEPVPAYHELQACTDRAADETQIMHESNIVHADWTYECQAIKGEHAWAK
jgi:hypothetical protein